MQLSVKISCYDIARSEYARYDGLHALKEIREDKDLTHIPTIVLTTSSFTRDEIDV